MNKPGLRDTDTILCCVQLLAAMLSVFKNFLNIYPCRRARCNIYYESLLQSAF